MKPDELISDSPRFRKRVAMAVHVFSGDERDYIELGKFLEGELGIDRPRFHGNTADRWKEFFLELETADVLDCVTLTYKRANNTLEATKRILGGKLLDSQKKQQGNLNRFKTKIERIFLEEHVGYELDAALGIHPRIDQAFSAAKASAVKGLSSEKYGPARNYIDEIDKCLLSNPIDGTGAIRNVYWAVENVGNQLLGTRELQGNALKGLQALLTKLSSNDEHLKAANATIVKSFGGWISSCHNYRHEKGSPEPHQPPPDLAILLVNQGLGFVRWLASLRREVDRFNSEANTLGVDADSMLSGE